MTLDEWDSISLLIENCWRGEFDEVRSKAYFTMLQRFDAAMVMAALHRIIEDGKQFIPTVPEIVAAVRKLETRALPSWTEVWSKIKIALGKGSDQAALDYLNDFHPTVAAFVASEGIEHLRFEPFYDPDYGSFRIRELHQRWDEFSERAVERQKRGLAIEASQRTSKGLGRMTAVDLLPPAED